MNAKQGFELRTPSGKVHKSSEEHIEFLKSWFKGDYNPKWTTKYLISNAFTTKEGVVKQWVTSGHNFSVFKKGNTVKLDQGYHV